MRDRHFLLLTFLAGLLLLLYDLGGQSLWLDEVMSLNVASGPVSEMVGFFHYLPEQHPVYYLMLRPVLLFGQSEFLLRLPSAVLAGLGPLGIYALAKELFDSRVGKASAVLLAVSPFWIYYGREARMYSLLGVLVILHSLLYLKWTRKGGWALGAAYIAMGILGFYSHFFFLFVPLAHLLFHWRRGRGVEVPLAKVLTSQVIMYAAYVPWAFLLLSNRPEGQAWKGLQHVVLGLPYTLLRFSVGYAVVPISYGWRERLAETAMADAPLLLVGVGCFGLLAVSGIRTAARDRGAGSFVCTALGVPVLAALLISVTVTVMMGERYLMVVFPFFILLLALGLVTMRRAKSSASRRIGVVAAVLLASVLGVGLYRLYFATGFGKEQWRDAASFVYERAEPGDAIVFHRSFVGDPFYYYFDQLDPPMTLAVGSELTERELRSKQRIWLVLSHARDMESCKEVLRKSHGLVETRLFPHEGGIFVHLLGRRTGDSVLAGSFGASSLAACA